ncbi:Piwi-domain-containing protein [Phanerochaete sordida]|uniref:Piwi-domain-containing protein n=1 Tax=Phanerochaete sordida TaxID=48140 RepID=A0A9P3G490_9APHY|nr:Piwi-domain-containing protein [Phanerochaete sordida]
MTSVSYPLIGPFDALTPSIAVIVQLSVRQRDGTTENKELKAGQRYTEIIETMQDQHAHIFVRRASYDGMKNLYSPTEIQGAMQFPVTIGPAKFSVLLKHAGVIDRRIFSHLISPGGANENLAAGKQAVAVNLIQILVSQAPHIRFKFSPHAKSFFLSESTNPKRLPGGLVALPGFFQSVRPVLNQFIINVDTTTAAFYPAGPLIDLTMDHWRLRSKRELRDRCDSYNELQKLSRFLKGLAVRIKMPGAIREGKRYIKELVPRVGQYKFQKGAHEVTVKEHFRHDYNFELQDPDLFGVKFSNGSVFPAEFCQIVPGQRYKRKLDPEQTREFLTASVRRPAQRLQEITQAVTGPLLMYNDSPYMRDAAISVDSAALVLRARELDAVQVQYHQTIETPRDGAWNVMQKRFIRPARINGWGVVNFDNRSNPAEAGRFASALFANMQKLAFKESKPGDIDFYYQDGNQAKASADLEQAERSIRHITGSVPDFLLVLLPANAPELRKEVKWWGDCVRGVPTQCVRGGKYNGAKNDRALDQYCNNVALKINAKTRGVASVPTTFCEGELSGVMVVGCDVSHPAPGVRGRPSIASVVSSWNATQTQYNVFLDCQAPRREMIERLANMMEHAVKAYHARNDDKLPKTILLYRDGVSEGEYAQVEEQEIKPLKQYLQSFFRQEFKLVFIVVGKRHHMRFFPADPSQGDRNGNCRAGLVVDQGVVHSSRLDFYLQSHAGIIGTSRSSHYVVLHNDMGWNANQLQGLSYKLCHVYAAATRSVSIPAPVYYADRACTRAAFQFDSGVPDFEGSTDDGNDCDVELWRDQLKQSRISHRMYFV